MKLMTQDLPVDLHQLANFDQWDNLSLIGTFFLC